MFLLNRSIFVIGLFILCNNTANISLLNVFACGYEEHLKSIDHEVREKTSGLQCSVQGSLEKHTILRERNQQVAMASGMGHIVHVEFEIFGRVQGVFFRKNTAEQAAKLNLKGWCMNTPAGTVKGAVEGDPLKIKEMKHWLSNVGSKRSRIDKAEFKNEKSITSFTFPNFSVRM